MLLWLRGLSGIELYVSENNLKTLNAFTRRLKANYKDTQAVAPHKMAYGLMPIHAVACLEAKQAYINDQRPFLLYG